MTLTADETRPLGAGNHLLVCVVCGREFGAKRSDALTCGDVCRQERFRRRHDVVNVDPPAFARRGQGRTAALKQLGRIIATRTENTYLVAESLRLTDVHAALEHPDAPLDEWEKALTSEIQLLSKLRRAIRDAQRA